MTWLVSGARPAAAADNALPAQAASEDWLALLGTSEQGGRQSTPRIEGTLPQQVSGALYRNGPGLFERGGLRKGHLLDGDGLVQKLSLHAGQAQYQNAFVQTPKFLSESQAGAYLFATWATRKPGGMLQNLGGGVSESQAGVTIYDVHGKLIARDEVGDNFVIDPETLTTAAQFPCGDPEQQSGVGFKAHSRIDPLTGEWLIAGQKFGPSMTLHTSAYGPDFALLRHHSIDAPRQVYIHDFFVTPSAFIFVLHPCVFSPMGFLAGLNSFTEALTWQPEAGNLICVVSRNDGATQFFDAPPAFMWHGLNAYEHQGEIIADFVGYDTPDHFIGEQAMFYTIMSGARGLAEAKGSVRRYIINPASGKLREEIVDPGNHEFPMLDPQNYLQETRIGYFASGGAAGGLNSGVKQINLKTGAQQSFDFGPEVHVGEPVYAPPPDGKPDQGWLICQCLDGASRTTFFALFEAANVAAGPIAKLWLDHHVPISFHGTWVPAA